MIKISLLTPVGALVLFGCRANPPDHPMGHDRPADVGQHANMRLATKISCTNMASMCS
jgi:hypothetical protein